MLGLGLALLGVAVRRRDTVWHASPSTALNARPLSRAFLWITSFFRTYTEPFSLKGRPAHRPPGQITTIMMLSP
jgi:hypothetical protein